VDEVTDARNSLQRRHAARLAQLLPEYVARIDWSPEQVRAEQLRALRQLLSDAVERSPWHRERLDGRDPMRLSADEVASLPPMTKDDLMENFDAIVTDRRVTRRVCEEHLERAAESPYLFDELTVVASGGSTGRRGVFVFGWDAWAICYASITRFQQRDWESDPALAHVPRVTAVVAASIPTHLSAAIGRTFSSPETPRHLFPVSRPLPELVAGLNELQPTILMSYSAFLPRLAAEARAGRLRIAPKRVIAISEPLLPEARSAAADAWECPVANGYGMSEGLFGGSCAHGLHLPDDLVLVEPVDAEGRPVEAGSPASRIYITNLYNQLLPLIRYEVTDELVLIDARCPCGSGLQRVADPQGRLDDVFEYDAGIAVHPHVFRSALAAKPEIVEYQVRQTARGVEVAVVSGSVIDLRAMEQTIAAALSRLGVDAPTVTVTRVQTLERHESGKLKRFVPLTG
jgi:phenylacetate-coenzyme A ligase PaaK-like adenylate-forming protein